MERNPSAPKQSSLATLFIVSREIDSSPLRKPLRGRRPTARRRRRARLHWLLQLVLVLLSVPALEAVEARLPGACAGHGAGGVGGAVWACWGRGLREHAREAVGLERIGVGGGVDVGLGGHGGGRLMMQVVGLGGSGCRWFMWFACLVVCG